jgi:SLT domain-containing protein
VAKGKVVIQEGQRKRDRKMVLMAKAAEMGGAKIFKPDGEEMVVEQMVLTSGINVQLE